MVNFICSSIFYLVISIISFLLLSKSKKNNKNGFFVVLVVSMLFTLYNVYCTKNTITMGSDRLNYLYEFNGFRNTSIGLTFVFNLVKIFTNNIEAVFYLSTFISCFIIFNVYLKSKSIDKNGLLFLLLTDVVFYSFTALKQIYTIAIATYFFYLIIEDKNIKTIYALLLIVVASMFHVTGYILFLIYFVFYITKRRKVNIPVLIILLIIGLLMLKPVVLGIASMLNGILPSLSEKILRYFSADNDNKLILSNVLKGIPFYVIIIVAAFKNKKLKNEQLNYDKLFLICLIGVTLFIASIYSYWLYRFVALFYVPFGVLFSVTMSSIKRSKDKLLYCSIVYIFEFLLLFRWLYLIYINFGGF